MRKHRNYWNEQTIKLHAKECNTWEEFKTKYSQGYKLGMKLGIIHDLFSLSRNPNNYWTEELVRNESLKYNSREEFKSNCQAAYNVAYKLKIMNELFPSKKSPKGYWTEYTIKEVAKNCEYKSEFQIKYGTAYNKAKKLNILDNLEFKLKGNLYKRCIYAIEFKDNHVYIGLTCDFIKRINKHFNDMSRNSSAREHLEIEKEFKTLMLSEYLDKDIASKKEIEFIEFYKNKGWNILNKVKAGGLGGNYSRWNKELVLKTALTYKCAKDFKYSKDGGGYCHAIRNKYNNELKYNKNAN